MKSDRFRRVRDIFLSVCDLEMAERETTLDRACADDAELRAEVESMLDGHGSDVGFLDEPALGSDFHVPAPETLDTNGARETELPQRFGHYRVLGVLGEGGMGIVYRAEQDSPRRAVALKVVKAGVANRERLRRFELEAEVLARLQHPGIAQVYEAGTADSGSGPQPFFAMELVRGEPLGHWVESNGVDVEGRIELLVGVCSAVHHAHQKGVVHRDLKPANILVDGAGNPKVVDFGVAHTADSDLQRTVLTTDAGELVGTLAYMSPEQVAGDPDGIDARSDVYALGLVAFELFTGRLPQDVRGKSLPEAVRVLSEEEPLRLGTVRRDLRGDLDTIVSKALEKERERRYASAADLAADLQRFLADEPIVARPATRLYQFQKFARRNKALVGGVAGVFLALVLGVFGTTRGMLAAGAAEERALQRAQGEQTQRERAENALEAVGLERDRLAASNAFLERMLRSIEPVADGRELRVADILDRTEEDLAEAFADQPDVEASLRDTIGMAYHSLGLFAAAEPQLRRALDIRRATLGDESPDTLLSIRNLANWLMVQGRYEEAEPLFWEALDGYRATLGAEHPDTIFTANRTALFLRKAGRLAEAVELSRDAHRASKAIRSGSHTETVNLLNGFALALLAAGELDDAEENLQRVLQIRTRDLGEDHHRTVMSRYNLAMLHVTRGRYAAAEPLVREVLELRIEVLGHEHPKTLQTRQLLGVLLLETGDATGAEDVLEGVRADRERLLGEDHPDTLATRVSLGSCLVEQGRLDEADTLVSEALEVFVASLGESHPETLLARERQVAVRLAQGRAAEAEVLGRIAAELAADTLPDGHWLEAACLATWGESLFDLGRRDEAKKQLVRSRPILLTGLGLEHPRSRKIRALLGRITVDAQGDAQGDE